MTQKEALKQITQKFDELNAAFAEQTKAFQTATQAEFKNIAKSLFELCPELRVVKWCQYTPYFNDGEECIFGVRAPTFTNAPAEDLTHWGEYDGEGFVYSDYNKAEPEEGQSVFWVYGEDAGGGADRTMPREYYEPLKAFKGIVTDKQFKSVLQTMFGDHVVIAITREGIDVNDFDHD